MTVDIQLKNHLLFCEENNLTGPCPFSKGFQTELSVSMVTQCTLIAPVMRRAALY